ncbi:MAG: glycosyltransferase [Euryarchaeota archaeon]|nr:glycosyltransferase [Euryarchaeota archaeon]
MTGLSISVILPVYNEEKFLARCLDNLLRVRYPGEWEILVVDDGSTDSSPRIAREYAARDPRVRFLQADHGGSSRAINLAIAQVRHEALYIAEADGTHSPDYFVNLASVLGSGVAGSNGPYYPMDQSRPAGRLRDNELHIHFHNPRYTPPCGRLYLTAPVREVGGFDPRVLRGQDIDLGRRLKEKGYRFQFVPRAEWAHAEPPTTREALRKSYIDGYNEATLLFRKSTLELNAAPRGGVGQRFDRIGAKRLVIPGFWTSIPLLLILAIPLRPLLWLLLAPGAYILYRSGRFIGAGLKYARYKHLLPLNILFWMAKGYPHTLGFAAGVLRGMRGTYKEVMYRE